MDASKLVKTSWFTGLCDQLRAELKIRTGDLKERRPALETEQQKLRQQSQGWAQTLAKPDLEPSLRAAVESHWEIALARLNEIAATLLELDGQVGSVDRLVNVADAAQRLQRLRDALESSNPTACNLELSQHIDKITCMPDGRVVLKICKLGPLREALSLVTNAAEVPQGLVASEPKSNTQRRRARLRTNPLALNASELKDAAHFAAESNRFANVGDQWFWIENLQIPAKTCWASEHAAQVATKRAEGVTMEELAKYFGKTIPTIRDALRRAGKQDPAIHNLPRKMPRRRWAVDHADEVADLKRRGMSVDEIAAKMDKSDTTIREALRLAQEREQSS